MRRSSWVGVLGLAGALGLVEVSLGGEAAPAPDPDLHPDTTTQRGTRTSSRTGAEGHLDRIARLGPRIREGGIGGLHGGALVQRLASEDRLGLVRAPGHGGNATKRDPRLPDRVAIQIERDSGGGER